MEDCEKIKVIETKEDNSTFTEKLKLIDKFGYLQKNRWERNDKRLVLSDDNLYSEYLLCKKNDVGSYNAIDESANVEVTSVFKEIPDSNTVFSTVYSYSFNIDYLEDDIDFFVSTYYLDNIKNKNNALNFVQLSRYDPSEKLIHINSFKNFNFQSTEEENMFKKYYTERAISPHYHFASRRNAEYLKSSTSLAISLPNLLQYVDDLRKDKITSEYTLNLPYCAIKEYPERYTTTLNKENFEIILEKMTKGRATKKIFRHLTSSEKYKKIKLFGLDAVYFDLYLLKRLYEDKLPPNPEIILKLGAKIMLEKHPEIPDKACEIILKNTKKHKKESDLNA